MPNPSAQFDAYYYQHNCGEPYQRSAAWMNLFEGIARRIATDIRPGTVLDAGCAWGFLVEKLRQKNIDAFGVDISEYAISQVDPSIRPFVQVGSVTEPFPQQYDLIVSIEVLEHLPKDQSERAIENLCQHTADILFSSTPFDYREISHVNVQPPDYWIEQFARHGFYRDVDFDAAFISPWAVRLRRKNEPLHRILREYDRKLWMLSKENLDLRVFAGELQEQVARCEQREAERQAGAGRRLARKLAPPGSRLEGWLKKTRDLFRTK